jgi:hypothetical protein
VSAKGNDFKLAGGGTRKNTVIAAKSPDVSEFAAQGCIVGIPAARSE